MFTLPRISLATASRLLAGLLLVLMSALQAAAEPEAAPDSAVLEQRVSERIAERVPEQAVLDQMLAPIALYPDALLAQILMAATYPLDVVEAARWSKAHPGLEGSEAVEAGGDSGWDPSVQALLAFPEILARMSDNLRWTRQLGLAFLAGEQQIMDTVQVLREKADSAGNLDNLEHARVYRQDKVIVIEPAQPQLIYVPYYNPMVIYGPWWRPAYPPVYWRPHPNHPLSGGLHWSAGIRLSSSYLFFSAFDWQRRHIVVLNPHVHMHQSRRIAGQYRGYYSNGYYRNPGRHGFERWQHRAEYRQRKPHQGVTGPGPHRYTAGSPRIERGSHSPTGSYIRPPTRLDPAADPRRSGADRSADRGTATQPRNRTEQHRAPDRSRSSDSPQHRSRNTDIQFRRGDPRYAPESRGGSSRSGQGPGSRVERSHTAGQRTAAPQRSMQGSQQRSLQSRPQSQQRGAPARGSDRSPSQQQR